MKTIEIIGDNYFGKYNKVRIACRAFVIKDNKILVSYETKNDRYQIPGGGLEENETNSECAIREVKEETGVIIAPSDCLLEINEYYEDTKYVNRYFIGTVIGNTTLDLTENEIEQGMEPRWIEIETLINILSDNEKYRDIEEEKRGMYLREYKAIKFIFNRGDENND